MRKFTNVLTETMQHAHIRYHMAWSGLVFPSSLDLKLSNSPNIKHTLAIRRSGQTKRRAWSGYKLFDTDGIPERFF